MAPPSAPLRSDGPTRSSNPGRRRAAFLLPLLLVPCLPLAPARALEEAVIQLPLLRTSFTVRLQELTSAADLRQGNSDLAELDRATDGAVGRQILALLQQPVPLHLKQVAERAVGSPLLEQALLVLSSFGSVEGRSADLSGRTLQEALLRASAGGEPTLLGLLQAIPGRRVTIDLGRAQQIATRMKRQRRLADALIAATSPATPPVLPPAATGPGATPPPAAIRRTLRLPVPHRAEPLELLVLEPAVGATGRLALISHGLWDTPANFEGWGLRLASGGTTVILPRHPGSDDSQQEAVLAGQAAPPGPEELARRPKDLIAVLDALQAGRLVLDRPVDVRHVVVLGHSWGATTALQLAGVQPSDRSLRQRCGNLDDPERNLSWTLQCSWLRGVGSAALADPRVIAVGAVSPPVSLLFPKGSGQTLSARVLLVSGSQDWVVPPDPEAVTPMRWGRRPGNQLVLADGGDHFNLRPGEQADGGVLGPLLQAWSEAAFAAGEEARPRPDAAPLLRSRDWGNSEIPLLEVTGALPPP
jgi:predicted dienelactone hydrolase